MGGLLYRMRGIERWPSTEATVTSTKIVSEGGRSGLTMNIYFDYNAGTTPQSGKCFVDSYSSLYGLTPGETFPVQFNPERPSSHYCSSAKSLSMTIRRGFLYFGVAFAIAGFVIIFFGNRAH